MDPITPATPAAPAQPAAAPTAPAPQSAVHAAIASNDTAAYRAARRAERSGTPLSVPAAPSTPTADATAAPVTDPASTTVDPKPTGEAERTLSKRQQQINDYERRIAEQNERIARLEAQTRPTTAPPTGADTPAPTAPAARTLQDELKTPDVSRAMLSEQEFFEKYPEAPYAAYARYWDRYDTAVDQREQAQQREHATQRERFAARGEQFGKSLREAAAADPAFTTKVAPELLHAKPLSALSRDSRTGAFVDPDTGRPATFANVVAEVAFSHSDNAAKFFEHLSTHQTDAAAIAAMGPDAWMPALLRLDGRVNPPVAPTAAAPTPPTKTVTDAPKPAPTLGSRPSEAADPLASAIKRNDTRAYRQLRRDQRAAGRGR